MINIKQLKRFCCEDISKIENYEAAISDKTQTWDCHHRWEIFMMLRISKQSLIESGLYYHQPADRLILLPSSEHASLHQKGMKKSEEHRRKIGEAHKGKKRSEETKLKISETLKGRPPINKGKKHSEETKRKISEAKKLYWKNKQRIEQ